MKIKYLKRINYGFVTILKFISSRLYLLYIEKLPIEFQYILCQFISFPNDKIFQDSFGCHTLIAMRSKIKEER